MRSKFKRRLPSKPAPAKVVEKNPPAPEAKDTGEKPKKSDRKIDGDMLSVIGHGGHGGDK